MSVSISIRGFCSKESDEFKKHYRAVEFCIKNDLSFPKETSEFFKGSVEGVCDLEDYKRECILDYIKNGKEIELKKKQNEMGEYILKIKDIPKEVKELIITLS